MRFNRGQSHRAAQREPLYPLFETVFGIPASLLSDFYDRGCWDPTYTPYSFYDGGRMVANASRFDLPLLVNGHPMTASGIQSVMTHPDWRGQGLMHDLMQRLLHDIDQQGVPALLFTTSPTLYESFQFHVVPESLFSTRVEHTPSSPSPRVQSLDPHSPADMILIDRLLSSRAPLSRIVSPASYRASWYLNLYDPTWTARLHYMPELNAILVFEQDHETLQLYDVVAPQMPALSHILDTAERAVSRVVFHFIPDALAVDTETTPMDTDTVLMARGIELPTSVIYPPLAHF